MNLETSVELVRRIRAGDAAAIDRLVARYQARIRRSMHGRLPRWARDLCDTEDLVQDALFRGLRRIGDFEPRGTGSLFSFLFTIALNRLRDELRRVKRRPLPAELHDGVPASDASPLEEVMGREAYARYELALASLTDDERGVLLARLEFGLDYRTIAEQLGRPSADAVRVAIKRAALKVARAMEQAERSA